MPVGKKLDGSGKNIRDLREECQILREECLRLREAQGSYKTVRLMDL